MLMNRRGFLQTIGVLAGSIGFLFQTQAEERRRGGTSTASGPQLVDPNDPGAKAVNYVHDHADLKEKSLQVDRTGVKFKDQLCLSCAFYENDKKKEVTVAGKKAAPCQMPFATGKVVSAKGWCSTWAKRA